MSVITQFLEGYEQLTKAIEGLSPEQMKLVIEEGKWTIYENVIHVVDAELVYAERIKRVIAEDAPVFLPFDQDLWTTQLNYHQSNIKDYLELFRLTRVTVASLLQEQDPSIWEKRGRKGAEEITLKQLIEALIDHVQNHVRTINRLTSKLKS
jgi:uncharacterized damage-inducible protein DinB